MHLNGQDYKINRGTWVAQWLASGSGLGLKVMKSSPT